MKFSIGIPTKPMSEIFVGFNQLKQHCLNSVKHSQLRLFARKAQFLSLALMFAIFAATVPHASADNQDTPSENSQSSENELGDISRNIWVTTSTVEISEGEDAIFTIELSEAPITNTAVTYMLAQTGDFIDEYDYYAAYSPTTLHTIEFTPEDSELDLTVGTDDDDDIEELDGMITVTLVGVNQGYRIDDVRSSVSVNIRDNDIPSISIYAVGTVVEGEEAWFAIKSDKSSWRNFDVRVQISEEGTEFLSNVSPFVSIVTILKGSTVTPLAIPTVVDDSSEGDGTITASILNADSTWELQYELSANLFQASITVGEDAESVGTVKRVTVEAVESYVQQEPVAKFKIRLTPAPETNVNVRFGVRHKRYKQRPDGRNIHELYQPVYVVNPANGKIPEEPTTESQSVVFLTGETEKTVIVHVEPGQTEGWKGIIGLSLISADEGYFIDSETRALSIHKSRIRRSDAFVNYDNNHVEYYNYNYGEFNSDDHGDSSVRTPKISFAKNLFTKIPYRFYEVSEGQTISIPIESSKPALENLTVNLSVAVVGKGWRDEWTTTAALLAGEVQTFAEIEVKDNSRVGDSDLKLLITTGEGYEPNESGKSWNFEILDDDVSKPVVNAVIVPRNIKAGEIMPYRILLNPKPTKNITVNLEVSQRGHIDHKNYAAYGTVNYKKFGSRFVKTLDTIVGDVPSTLLIRPTDIVTQNGISYYPLNFATKSNPIMQNTLVSVTVLEGENYTVGESYSLEGTTRVHRVPPDVQIVGNTAGSIVEGEDAVFGFEVSYHVGTRYGVRVNLSITQSGNFLSKMPKNYIHIYPSIEADYRSITSEFLVLETEDDQLSEENGYIDVRILPGQDYVVGALSTKRIIVKDNDNAENPIISVSAIDSEIHENESVRFQISAVPAPSRDLSVEMNLTQNGSFLNTATGSHYVQIAAKTEEAFFTPIIENDEVDEQSGSIAVTVVDGVGYVPGNYPDNTAVISIQDDDIPSISIVAASESITEGEDVEFVISSDIAPWSDLTVNLEVTHEGEFIEEPAISSVVLLADTRTHTFSMATINDHTEEENGIVTVSIQQGIGYTSNNNTATISVLDNEDPTIDTVVHYSNRPTISIIADEHAVSYSQYNYVVLHTSAPTSGIQLSAFDVIVVKVRETKYFEDDSTETDVYDIEIWVRNISDSGLTNIQGSINRISEETKKKLGTKYELIPDDGYNVSLLQNSVYISNNYDVTTKGSAIPTVSVSSSLYELYNSSSVVTYRADPPPLERLDVSAITHCEGEGPRMHTIRFDNFHSGMGISQLYWSRSRGSCTTTLIPDENNSYIVADAPRNSVTVTFSNDIPEVGIEAMSNVVNEGERVEFEISVSPAPAGFVEINLKVTESGDFINLDGTTKYILGMNSVVPEKFVVETIDDVASEEDSQLTVEVLDGENYVVSPLKSKAVVTILDNDVARVTGEPVVTITATDSVIYESGMAIFEIEAIPIPTEDLNIKIYFDHTMSEENLSNPVPQIMNVTMTPSDSSRPGVVRLTYPIVDDEVDEPDGEMMAYVIDGDGYSPGAFPNNYAEISVLDDDIPTVSISTSGLVGPVTEGESVRFMLTLDRASFRDINVHVQADDGDSDFLRASPTLNIVTTIVQGSTSQEFELESVSDNMDEQDGIITVRVVDGNGYEPDAAHSSATVSVKDDDVPIVSIINHWADSIIEGEDAIFALRIQYPLRQDLSVNISATQSSDFLAEPVIRPVAVTAGATFHSFILSTIDDDNDENDGTITLNIQPSPDYTSFNNTVIKWVLDNDRALQVENPEDDSATSDGNKPTALIYGNKVGLKPPSSGVQLSSSDRIFVRWRVLEIYHEEVKEVYRSYEKFTSPWNFQSKSLHTTHIGINYENPNLLGVRIELIPYESYNLSLLQNSLYIEVNPRTESEKTGQPTISVSAPYELIQSGNYGVFVFRADPAPVGNLNVYTRTLCDESTVLRPITNTPVVTFYGESITTLRIHASCTITIEPDANNNYLVAAAPNNSATMTVTHELPEVEIETQAETVIEGERIEFAIKVSHQPAQVLELNMRVSETGNFVNEDGNEKFRLEPHQVKFKPVKFEIETIDDRISEEDAEITVELLNGDGYVVSTSNSSETVTVLDNDGPPIMSISTITHSVTEGDTIWYLISADRASASQKAVNVMVSEPDSSFLDDNVPSRVTLWAYYKFVYLRVRTVDNTIDEANGEITVQIDAGEGYTVSLAEDSAKAAILDDDDPPPIVSVSSIVDTLTEGDNASFSISATSAPSEALKINVRVTQTGDYILDEPPTEVQLNAHESSAALLIATLDDELGEPDGSVSVELIAGEGYDVVPSPNNSATVIISDNDEAMEVPTVTISPVARNITEGATGWFEISADSSVRSDLAINVLVAMSGISSVETITMGAGESSVRLSVPTRDDELYDSEKTIVATISENFYYEVHDTEGTASITVDDNEPTPLISVEAITASVTEGTPVWFLFRASQASISTQTINISVVENVGDYLEDSAPESLTIMPYYRLSIESLSTVDDEFVDGDGSIAVSIEEGENYEVSVDNGTATVAVLDNDVSGPPPMLSVSSVVSSITEGGIALFRVHASNTPSDDISVILSIRQSGEFIINTVPTEVTIRKHNSLGLVFVQTLDDEVDESDGSITVELHPGSGYEVESGEGSQSTVTVVDNDDAVAAPEIAISTLSTSVIEGNDAVFLILSSSPVEANTIVTVKVTRIGEFFEDDADETIEVMLYTGELSKSFVIETIGDSVQESDGAVLVEIEPVSGSSLTYGIDRDNASATVNVTDDDNHATVSIAPVATQITEGDTAEFTVSSSISLQSDLTINVIVSETGNMISTPIPISVVLPAGQSSNTVEVETVNDSTNETGSTITMALRNGTGYTVAASPKNSAEVAVTDDDQTRIEVRISNNSGNYQQVEGRDLWVYLSTNNPYFSNVDRDLTVNIRVSETRSKLVGPLPTTAVIRAGTNQVIVKLPTVCDERLENVDPTSTITVEILPGDGYYTEQLATPNNVNSFGYKSSMELASAGIGQQGDGQCPGDQVVTIAAESASVEEGENAGFTLTTDIRKQQSRSIFVNIGNDNGNFIATPEKREVRLPATENRVTFSVGTEVINGGGEDGVIFASVAEGYASTDGSGSGFVPGTPSRATVTIRNNTSAPQSELSAALHRNVLPSLMEASAERTNSVLNTRIEMAYAESDSYSFELKGMNTVQDMVKYGGNLANGSSASLKELLTDSSFSMQLVPDSGVNGIATFWGSGFSRDVSNSGDDNLVSWDGEMFSGHFGMDTRIGRGLLTGLSASSNESSVEFEHVYGFSGYEGTYGVQMTSLQPYAAWLSEDLNSLLQFSAGYGIGEVRMDFEGFDPVATESSQFTVNVAGRDRLFSSEILFGGGLSELTVSGGAYATTQFVKAHGIEITGVTVGAQRVNLIANAAHSHETDDGSAISPEVTIGSYWKSENGDAVLGYLMGNRVDYSSQSGLDLSGAANLLLNGSAGILGLKSELTYDYGRDGVGIFTSVSPVIGGAALREIQGILNDGASEFTVSESLNEDLVHTDMEIGYGYQVFDGTAVISPFGGATVAEGGRNSYRLGSRLELGTDLRLGLESGMEKRQSGAMDRNVRFDGSMQW